MLSQAILILKWKWLVVIPRHSRFMKLSRFQQQWRFCIPKSCASAVQVVVVGLGSRQNALSFSKLLDFPLRLLYAGEPSSLPQSFCVETLHQQLSTPASYPTVAAWPALSRPTALVCLHYRVSSSFASVLRLCNISMGL